MACCSSLLAFLCGKEPKEGPASLSPVEALSQGKTPTASNGIGHAVIEISGSSPATPPIEEPEHENSVSPALSLNPPPKEYEPRKPEELWNLAYDSLRGEDGNPKLTRAYEAVLFRISDTPAQTLTEPIDQIPEVDDTARLEQLTNAVEKGRERIEKFVEAKEFTGDVLKVVLSAKDLIGNALSAFPQAAAAWTGVTLVFEVRRI